MFLDFLLSDPRLPLLSIPALWVLNLAPAVLKTVTIGMTVGWANVKPRSNIDNIADRELAKMVKRMAAAHENALESFPLWIAAVLAATITKVDTLTVNYAVIVFFCLRALYTMVYISQKTKAQGLLRTAIWVAACNVPLRLLFQAAEAAAQY